jgi:thiol-disulfide isomerase/thioredoxin
MEREMNRRAVGIASLSVLVLLAAAGVLYVRLSHSRQLINASSAPVSAPIAVGQTAPEFSLPSTAGTFDLDKESTPVFLEIFATWCPHCQRETVVLNKLYEAYKSKVAFLAIPGSDTGMDESSPESQDDVLNFQRRFNVRYPIGAFDPNLVVAKRYLLGGYPTIVIVDRQKKITYANSGEVPYAELAAALDKTLK